MPPRIPTPEKRPVKKLPIVATVVMTVGGLLIFLVLWNIAVNLQEENLPRGKPGTFEAP